MLRCPVARIGIVELGRCRLGLGHELTHAIGFDRGVNHQHHGRCRQRGHRHEVLHRIEGQLLHRCVDGDGVGRHEQGVAVGRSLGDDVRTNVAARPALVVDDQRLAEQFARTTGHGPGQYVGAAASGVRNHQPDRSVRVTLRQRACGHQPGRSAQGQKGVSSRYGHG